MNRYLVVYKVIHSHYNYGLLENKDKEEILNDIIENDKLNEELFEKVYNHHMHEMVCILNVIKLDN